MNRIGTTALAIVPIPILSILESCPKKPRQRRRRLKERMDQWEIENLMIIVADDVGREMLGFFRKRLGVADLPPSSSSSFG